MLLCALQCKSTVPDQQSCRSYRTAGEREMSGKRKARLGNILH